jgi:hypothetical protein
MVEYKILDKKEYSKDRIEALEEIEHKYNEDMQLSLNFFLRGKHEQKH